METGVARSELFLYVSSLQIARSAWISRGPALLAILSFITARVVLGGPTFFRYRIWAIIAVVLLMIHAVLEWYRNQARITLDGRHLHVTVPLLGNITFDLDGFQRAVVVAPDLPLWIFQVVAFSVASLLLILEVYHFPSEATVDPVNIFLAVEFLVLTFQIHRQRDYKSLVMWFGMHTDWRRHVWSQRKVTFRGQEEVLQELKRQVEAAVNGLASP